MEKLEMSELRRQINTVMQRVVNSQDRIDAKELKLLQKKEIEMSKIQQFQPCPVPDYDPEKEKWLDLDGTQSIYLRVIFGNQNQPITDLNFFNIQSKYDNKIVSKNFISVQVISKGEIEPIPWIRWEDQGYRLKIKKTITEAVDVTY